MYNTLGLLEVEHSTVTPPVFSATGGTARQATTFYQRLAYSYMLADQQYSSAFRLCWTRSRIAFSLLRSAIQSIVSR